jgi:hypothetical protein
MHLSMQRLGLPLFEKNISVLGSLCKVNLVQHQLFPSIVKQSMHVSVVTAHLNALSEKKKTTCP